MNDKEGRKWLLQKLYNNGVKYIVFCKFYNGYVGVKEKPRFGVDGEPINGIAHIITLGYLLPDFNEPNYLDIGKYLGVVDWSKVAVDTPIKVQRGNGVVVNRHFATYDNGNVYYYQDGRTSWSNVGTKSVPAKRAILEGDNNEN